MYCSIHLQNFYGGITLSKKLINLLVLSFAILCFIGGITFMAASIVYARDNMEEMGVAVLYSKNRIPAGTILTVNNVSDYVGTKVVKNVDLVPTAITLNRNVNNSLFAAVIGVFIVNELDTPADTLAAFIGLQAVTTISENVQLEGKFFSKDEIAPDERLFSIPMDYRLGLGGEIQVGDIVDLWVYGSKAAVKIYDGARVFKLKGENNIDIMPGMTSSPVLAIFKMTEDAIALIRQAQSDGSIFLVKHGVQ
jgi:hypothetical protein